MLQRTMDVLARKFPPYRLALGFSSGPFSLPGALPIHGDVKAGLAAPAAQRQLDERHVGVALPDQLGEIERAAVAAGLAADEHGEAAPDVAARRWRPALGGHRM